MKVQIEFVGWLQEKGQDKNLEVEVVKEATLYLLVQQLNIRLQLDNTNHRISRSNCLILVNGKEIGVIKGLQTTLFDSDIVTIIPVTHGG